ncbi:hypothetical protein KP005_14245 [Geomonas nitrogeniifigens]|uniref:DNA-binding protein n=1 Tax=Geomonas diazotrophica TaxID=2843197 RepID=A0ABX8JHA8_9BACT|nr:hypothetical protein [Geomonas nitrogeniifigens]QWV96526.1 hypothetical protein KP005_14245 [Geomonas nitrogeniifigens]
MKVFTKAVALGVFLALPLAVYAADTKATPSAKMYKVSEVFKNKATLNKQQVSVKGKVVKTSAGIMGKNWIHIQDGSGSAAAKDNDLTVTTNQDLPSTGTVVTVTGTMVKDKDFGSGYFYPAIIESATFK